MTEGTVGGTTARSLKANKSTVQQLPNGQITLNIPRAIAQAMDYKKGDKVEFTIEGGSIVLRKR